MPSEWHPQTRILSPLLVVPRHVRLTKEESVDVVRSMMAKKGGPSK
jgi:hypothetical protein